METVVFKEVPGCPIHLDVYPASQAGPSPVIVWIHGGALMGGGREGMQPVLRDLLADAGFAQVSIDYRLAPESKLPEILEDMRDGFAWVRGEGVARFGFDPERVGVIGHSAGGYLTLLAGHAVVPRPQALVSYYGYGDIIGPWYSAPDPFYSAQPPVSREEAHAVLAAGCLSNATGNRDRFRFYLYCRQHGLWPEQVLGVDPHANPEAFQPYQPIAQVTADYPPTLLLHGTGDTDVPYQRSAEMAMVLQEASVRHALITIPDGPHGFDGRVKAEDLDAPEPGSAAHALLDTVRFFGMYV